MQPAQPAGRPVTLAAILVDFLYPHLNANSGFAYRGRRDLLVFKIWEHLRERNEDELVTDPLGSLRQAVRIVPDSISAAVRARQAGGAEEQLLMTRARTILDQLPPRRRRTLSLYMQFEWTLERIAKSQIRSVTSVKTDVLSALETVSAELSRRSRSSDNDTQLEC